MTLRSNCLTLKESRFKFQVIHVLFTSILWDALKKEDLILSIRNNIESKYNLQLEKKKANRTTNVRINGDSVLMPRLPIPMQARPSIVFIYNQREEKNSRKINVSLKYL